LTKLSGKKLRGLANSISGAVQASRNSNVGAHQGGQKVEGGKVEK
jgi:hypothetical protein